MVHNLLFMTLISGSDYMEILTELGIIEKKICQYWNVKLLSHSNISKVIGSINTKFIPINNYGIGSQSSESIYYEQNWSTENITWF